ncbi:tripartite tricarboxylate transporter substrate-binding protein [Cupriavidus necator]|uniref:tripartite tricarboxylate transporter substrate-binding protein n=1 Tax=Cupriavidus necator TaxID=106590 RepID=UPI00148F824A
MAAAGVLSAAGGITPRRASAAELMHLVVGYGAGGGADHVARLVADSLSAPGSTLLVENRPGAAGLVALQAVLHAPAERPALLLGTVGSVSIAPLLSPQAADAGRLHAVAVIGSTPHVLLAGAAAPAAPPPAAALHGWLEQARRRPGQIGFASPGMYSSAHLVGELMCRQAGVRMAHIPYPGSARALADLQGGHIALLVSTLQAALPLLRQNRVRALAVTGARRSPLAPDTPTFAEAGLAAMHHAAWYGVLAAPTVAAPARDALALRLHAALQRTALRQRLTQDGAEPLGWVGPAAADYLAAQRESWRDAVALVGTRLG